MFLEKLQIVNYKNNRNVNYYFKDGVNTIIGENDSGKSNALQALRILLDDTYYYSIKTLKESDFFNKLDNWRGHWIIISATFNNIKQEEKANEYISQMIYNELTQFATNDFGNEHQYSGTVTLFIRPNKEKRKELFQSGPEKFDEVRNSITLSDYEFVYTARSISDFTNEDFYSKIVGNFDNKKYADPGNLDEKEIGVKFEITNLWKYISIEFIDALRDAERELNKPKNPIRKIIDTIQSEIKVCDLESIRNKINDLNNCISSVEQIKNISSDINERLLEMIGMVYSPQIELTSQLTDDISILSKYISVIPEDLNNINELGLGHLNILYIALKLVEYKYNANKGLLNIMIIEEPEAHIHTHIQKTLFDNLDLKNKYTQIICTTHSTHLSAVSSIERLTILKVDNGETIVMNPTNELNEFGKELLKLKDHTLIDSLERYLDAKRSTLLFAKSVILVEGDGEEILIPTMVKEALGISLDEIGISLINVGSVAFENIACIFDETRLKRKCAIITDMDKQISGSTHFKPKAEENGISRCEKLENLFGENEFVKSFFADYTLEIDFAKEEQNKEFINEIIDEHYEKETTIHRHKENLRGNINDWYDSMMTMIDDIQKGWYAVLMSQKIDCSVIIPEYILRAVAYASCDILSEKILYKIISYSFDCLKSEYQNETLKSHIENNNLSSEDIDLFIELYPDNVVSRYIIYAREYQK